MANLQLETEDSHQPEPPTEQVPPTQVESTNNHSQIQTESRYLPWANQQMSTGSTVDSATYTESFNPRSRPGPSGSTSAAEIADGFFATLTTTEGIDSQKRSPSNPSIDNQFGAHT